MPDFGTWRPYFKMQRMREQAEQVQQLPQQALPQMPAGSQRAMDNGT